MGRSQSVPRVGLPSGREGATKPAELAQGMADDSGCPILHVDMDAFFASVEVRRRPELAGRPVIIGGIGARGVVSSATYEARTFGVRSAMPMARAMRLCPQAIAVAPDHAEYSRVSAAIMEIFRSITPLVEPLSLDEAFLDVGGARRRLGPPATIAAMIREQVSAEQQLTCSVGIASTKFVAKIASTRCKPDGMLVVPADQVLEFLHPLPVAALWGVGARTEEQLRRVGLRTIADIAAMPVARLRGIVGAAGAEHLSALAHGRDPRAVVPREAEKSISAEETFAVDVFEVEVIHRELLRLAAKTARRLRASGVRSRTISIKVRLADFTTLNRSRTLDRATDSGQEIYAVARDLFDRLDRGGAPVRLVGVRGEGLADAEESSEQLLLGEPEYGWRDADRAIDAAARRFGGEIVRPASLLEARKRPDQGPEGGSAGN